MEEDPFKSNLHCAVLRIFKMNEEKAQKGPENQKMDRGSSTHRIKLGSITAFTSRSRISAEGNTTSNGSASKHTGKTPTLDLETAYTWSDDMQGLGCLDSTRSILLRFECMTGAELKVIACFRSDCAAVLCRTLLSIVKSPVMSQIPGTGAPPCLVSIRC